MKIRKMFRYRLKPNTSQIKQFQEFAGSCRFLFNRALARCIEVYQKSKVCLGYNDLANELPILKQAPETIWLSSIHSQVLQHALKDLDNAFKQFFRNLKKGKKGFPRFKKKGAKESFRYPEGVKVDGNRVFLPKIGWVRFCNSRPIEGTINQTTIKYAAGHWYLTFSTTQEKEVVPVPIRRSKILGIDFGISLLAVPSNEEVIENPKYLRKHEKKLAFEQRSLSRKKKGSTNWAKQKVKVAKAYACVKNSRNDHAHKTTTKIVESQDVIVVESLNISGMMSNHNLAKSISDAIWHRLISMFEYKSEYSGKHFVKIPAFSPTSQICSSCGARQKMPLNVRVYSCDKCSLRLDRDLNASINIRAAGLSVLEACGGTDVGLPYEARIPWV